MHLSNQVNDDIKAIVREDTELQVKDEPRVADAS